ncbi:MAG TPA: nuclear transport factor 2 family protein [Ktedonobacterales bacterium]|nr:nuclear transport factor 2 family protein [Ktedonobacterales bacterium]
MAVSQSSLARLLVVESAPLLREALLSLLIEEGYAARGIASLEEALRDLDEQPYDLILAELFAGASKHSFAPAHVLRRRAHPIPLGLITTQSRVLQAPRAAGFAFAVPRPIDVSLLLTEIATCLQTPLQAEQQAQARTIERFLTAWGVEEWKSMLSLCTEEIIWYSSPLFPLPVTAVSGKMGVLRLVSDIRRNYQSLRVEAQKVYDRPHGLAARVFGSAAERGRGWQLFSGTALFAFEGERICQIGLPLSYQRWKGLLEPPGASFGAG